MKFDSDISSSNPNSAPSTDDLEHEIKTAADIDNYFIKSKTYMLAPNLSDHLNMPSPCSYPNSNCGSLVGSNSLLSKNIVIGIRVTHYDCTSAFLSNQIIKLLNRCF